MEFSIKEKLAIVKVIDSVIVADDEVHKDELNFLGKLMARIDFDSNFIISARGIDSAQGFQILAEMDMKKKEYLSIVLKDMAMADGFVHEKEKKVLSIVLSSMGMRND